MLINNEIKLNTVINNISDEYLSFYIKKLYDETNENILIVTNTISEAIKFKTYLESIRIESFLFLMDDFFTSEAISISPELKTERLETLNSIINTKKNIVITNLDGYVRFLPSKLLYKQNIFELKSNEEIDLKKLQFYIDNLGYSRTNLVRKTGDYAVRGYILDIFLIGYDNPFRIEFFGDYIESIRSFDIDTQKSIEIQNKITIYPFTEFITENNVTNSNQKYLSSYGKVYNIADYLNNPILIFIEYSKQINIYDNLKKEIDKYKKNNDNEYSGSYIHDIHKTKKEKYIFLERLNVIDTSENNFLYPPLFREDINFINSFISKYILEGYKIIFSVEDYRVKSLEKNIKFPINIVKNIDSLKENVINILISNFERGFIVDKIVMITSYELFNNYKKNYKYKNNFKFSQKINNITKLKIGDYVVHNTCGIGIYNGIRTISKAGLLKDYIEVLYKGNDKLYIPVEKIELLTKYSDNEYTIPKISKMNSLEWHKIKSKVKNSIKKMALNLLEINAEREMRSGFSFSKDNSLQIEFEKEFIYETTKDQEKSIMDIKIDMEKSNPMDRLLCGDVGYGKTEVAFRAMFKAVLDSKQVMYLCPTTVLSLQQYKNAVTRFSNYPIKISLLNRFTSTKDTKKILEDLKNGKIDILFGTHKLLSENVIYRDLGLLVIDEEHRFGVEHKEKIKSLKTNIDILTMTATPIPRTLQMSLVGLRSLSVIETPPKNRFPVQTYVIEESDYIIKDAIEKELARGGQVFLLLNNISSIDSMVSKIKKLVPTAIIDYAHGQMSKNDLEDRMISFIDGKYDVMVCTTIIETGIDIPNVNTLIILDADHFGLSQLYQIRGRVGRSDRIAYAYLMYNKGKVLSTNAEKRLSVIREFTELGSGFSIATRDLSIRGAGNILGSEQSGFSEEVGVELYLKMLNEEILRLKGKNIEEEQDNKKPLLNVATAIDDSYIEDHDLKIEVHKKINNIETLADLFDLKEELIDRFGKLSENMIIYMYEELLEKLVKKLEIIDFRNNKNSIELFFSEEISKKINIEELFVTSYNISPYFRFSSKNNLLIIILDVIKLEKHPVYYLVDLLNIINIKED